MGDVTRLTGDEDVVFFLPGQSFTGVLEDWLLDRLRVSPAASPLDLSPEREGGPLGVALDGVWVDVDEWDGVAPGVAWREIATAKDQRVMEATADVGGGWLRDSWPEIRLIYTWMGPDPDLHAVVLDWAHRYVTEWVEMLAESPLELASDHLSAARLADRTRLMGPGDMTGLQPILNGRPLAAGMKSTLTGDEDVVWFMSGEAFTGASEEWLRPRLRLDPAEHDFDLDYGALHVDLDGQIIEDLELDDVLGTGPNDGELVAIEGPDGSGASGCVYGGWLETVAPDMSHDILWIGLDPDLQTVVSDWVTGWLATWGDVEVTFDRMNLVEVGMADDA